MLWECNYDAVGVMGGEREGDRQTGMGDGKEARTRLASSGMVHATRDIARVSAVGAGIAHRALTS